MVFSFVQKTNHQLCESLKQIITQDYNNALAKYWSHNFQEAADFVSMCILNNSTHKNLLPFYRLWIEILAETSDKQSLKALKNHIRTRCSVEPEYSQHFWALQGLIHLELDELEAVSLIDQTLKSNLENPYYWEFKSKLRLRSQDKKPFPNFKFSSPQDLQDFFYWETLAKEALLTRNHDSLESVLECIAQVFPSSPTPKLFSMHLHLDQGCFSEAVLDANYLLKLYPESSDYKIFSAYGKLRSGNVNGALKDLKEVQDTAEDADVLTLLGCSYAELSHSSNNKVHTEQAIQYLQKALNINKVHGYSTSWLSNKIHSITSMEKNTSEDIMSNTKSDIEPARIWLVKLSPRHQFELQTSPKKAIEHITRPMGNTPKPGDLCFFAASSGVSTDQERWRIVATYSVVSDPVWHPYYRNVSTLKLESLESIPVDVCLLDEKDQATMVKLGKNHPYRYGVFELEEGALSVITEIIKQHHQTGKDKESSRYSRSS